MPKEIAVLGVPMDLGQGRRGVDMGPSALRYGRLEERLEALGHKVRDLGDIDVPTAEELDIPHSGPRGGLGFLDEIRKACDATARRLESLADDVFPIVLGGDHSISIGSVIGSARGQRIGVVWGAPVRPEDVALIGVRDLDDRERELMREAGVTVHTMKEIDRVGLPEIAEATMAQLGHLSRLHVSFDADVLDPEIAPGVGTPVPGGLTFREAHLLMELFADSGSVTSLDLVEVNPILDRHNLTANTLVDLAASLLGKKIY
jgi:arginase